MNLFNRKLTFEEEQINLTKNKINWILKGLNKHNRCQCFSEIIEVKNQLRMLLDWKIEQ